jgi:molybdopterin-synthase adenylyltransferase
MLTDDDRQRYQWQLGCEGFGEAGQERLVRASVLVSRVGGVGGAVAQQLAVAGVGKLTLAHAGPLRLDDLNRQILMSHAGIGTPRVHQAAQRLAALNPTITVVPVEENVTEANVDGLVRQADVVASCAPLFEERLLLNRAAVQQGKPLVDCAMFDTLVQLTTIVPGRTPCLACLYPEPPAAWKRRFPVFGAVAGAVGCMGAMEVIKLIAGFGETLAGHMLVGDLREMSFRRVKLRERDAKCSTCSNCTQHGLRGINPYTVPS